MSRQMDKNIPLQYTKAFTFKQRVILMGFKDPSLPFLLIIYFEIQKFFYEFPFDKYSNECIALKHNYLHAKRRK